MNNIFRSFTIAALSLLLFSCGNSKSSLNLIDNPPLIATLQKHIDGVIEEGYQIDCIDIYTKEFAKHGPDYVGDMEFMYVRAVPSNQDIEYLANFSYSPQLNSLTFLGYPVSPSNKRKTKPYTVNPNLSDALRYLDEIKKLIPEDYAYQTLFAMSYNTTDDGQGVYEFKIEVTPTSKAASHPSVLREDKTYNKFTVSRNSKHHVGGVRDVHQNKLIKKEQYTIRFRLKNETIELL